MSSGHSFNPFTEFPNLGRPKIKEYEKIYKQHDTNQKGYLDLEDCKKIMEYIGQPQTHLGLKRLIKQASDNEPVQCNPPNTLSFYGFLSICDNNDKENENGDLDLSQKSLEKEDNVSVAEKGVSGAKNFFAAKISQQSKSNEAENEIKKSIMERKKKNAEAAERKNNFKDRISMFNSGSAFK